MKKLTVSLIGLIDEENNVLISKRRKSVQYNNFWEFPGGKVEKGECFIDAVIREAKEEIGLSLNPSCVSPLTFANDKVEDQDILLLLFICRKWNEQPVSMEGQELKWVKPAELNAFKMPPANIFLNSILRDWLGNS
jgi:8-oxo-dGTP diphosphatase